MPKLMLTPNDLSRRHMLIPELSCVRVGHLLAATDLVPGQLHATHRPGRAPRSRQMLATWVEVDDADLRQRRSSFRVTGDSHQPDESKCVCVLP
jgi:hypothetical protein